MRNIRMIVADGIFFVIFFFLPRPSTLVPRPCRHEQIRIPHLSPDRPEAIVGIAVLRRVAVVGREPLVVIADDHKVVGFRDHPETEIHKDNDGSLSVNLCFHLFHGPPAGLRLKPLLTGIALEIGNESPLEFLAVDRGADGLLIRGDPMERHDRGQRGRAAELRVLPDERNALDLESEGVRSQQ